MRLKSVSIKNFRCYRDEIKVSFDNLTTFIGKNDIGKSSILEALEIFFNNQTIKCDQDDLNIHCSELEITITCEFDNYPTTLILDSGAVTSLSEEYLLNKNGLLEIKKVFDCSKKTPSVEVFIIAIHPSERGFDNLLELKEKELQAIIKEKGLQISLKGNPNMRKAIWASAENLKCIEVLVPVSKPKEDSKRIWEQIESYLPVYALFQSDRNSQDSDSEVQNPMKAAIATAIAEVQDDIDRIQKKVKDKAEEIAKQTHIALNTIDPKLAQILVPQFNPPTLAKWTGLFSISMDTDDGIALNKRGSGVRRMILVSFFKAEAERRLKSTNKRSIIFALEEPETAQHPNNQKILIESFKTLSQSEDCQVILTTHSPGLAAELPSDSIRFIKKDNNENPMIETGIDVFEEVAKVLGIIPDSRVKVLLCVEGPTDVVAIKCLSRVLNQYNTNLPNLFDDPRIAVITLGGSTLQHWVSENYLKKLGCPEVHIYDNDVKSYQQSVDLVNARNDGSWAVLTNKHEIECYLHDDAINEGCGVEVNVIDIPGIDGKSVPKIFAEAYSKKHNLEGILKDNTAKNYLSRAFERMTFDRLSNRDPQGEVKGWFVRLLKMVNSM